MHDAARVDVCESREQHVADPADRGFRQQAKAGLHKDGEVKGQALKDKNNSPPTESRGGVGVGQVVVVVVVGRGGGGCGGGGRWCALSAGWNGCTFLAVCARRVLLRLAFHIGGKKTKHVLVRKDAVALELPVRRHGKVCVQGSGPTGEQR